MSLPLTETLTPDTSDALVDAMRDAIARSVSIYPLGGGCSLDFGLPARTPGLGLATRGLARVVDYPARDMTITVESGITFAELAAILNQERQRLPIDAPQAEQATLGGLIATNFSGPRRFGAGTLRDYVIGIRAVDGTGTVFNAGGRVVKNVAGYDFCKLLTGSLGTLAVITQVTLKVRPQPETTAWVAARVESPEKAEPWMAGLVERRLIPMAAEWVGGAAWRDLFPDAPLAEHESWLLAGLEGTEPEVAWQAGEFERLGSNLGLRDVRRVVGAEAQRLWSRLIEGSRTDGALVVLKASVLPSRVTSMWPALSALGRGVSLQAHAATGQIIARFEHEGLGQLARPLVQIAQPTALTAGGSIIVWSAAQPDDLTRIVAWGPTRGDWGMMQSIRRQFDPAGLLNPGRFVYDA